MNTHKKTVRDVEVRGKKVLLRCDFNVPQDKETGAITSDKRIVAALPTIRYLLDHPDEARQLGENGRRAVKEEFNWGVEEKKLLSLYEEVLAK